MEIYYIYKYLIFYVQIHKNIQYLDGSWFAFYPTNNICNNMQQATQKMSDSCLILFFIQLFLERNTKKVLQTHFMRYLIITIICILHVSQNPLFFLKSL